MKVVAVVPAAGKAERFGSQKLVADLDGRPLVARTIDALVDGGVTRVVLVTAISSAVGDPRAMSVVNEQPDRGMFSSIQAGMRMVGKTDVVIVLPADMPFVRGKTVALVADTCARTSRTTVATYRGKRGHPVALPRAVVDAVVDADPAFTLKQILAGFALDEVAVEDPGVVRDVDRPEDLEAPQGP